MQTTYEDFLTGDQEDRDMDREDACIEAERDALIEAKRLQQRRGETPHLPGEWP